MKNHILRTPWPIGKQYRFVALENVPANYILRAMGNIKKHYPALFNFISENHEYLKFLGEKTLADDKLTEKEERCVKLAYFSEKLAKAELKRISGLITHNKKPVRAYECDKCSQWHITSLSIEEYRNQIKK